VCRRCKMCAASRGNVECQAILFALSLVKINCGSVRVKKPHQESSLLSFRSPMHIDTQTFLSATTFANPLDCQQYSTMSSSMATEDPYKSLNNKERVYASLHDHMMQLFETGKFKEAIRVAEKLLMVCHVAAPLIRRYNSPCSPPRKRTCLY
jgi:hypothetical protein